MKKLVITEKPSVAREIARVLGCTNKKDGAIYGTNYIVTWALGHLVTLATPEELDKKWAVWKLEDLPMIPEKFETRVIKEVSKQYTVVKNLLKSNEVSELIVATDAGLEGELVARWIINKVGFKKPIKRLWISSMTDKAIIDGFKNLKDAKKYDNLYYSAESRAIADWLVGLNVTRALTCKYNAQLSAGRVQTPTLAMIVEREEEISKFKPVEYYNIYIKVKGIDFIYTVNNVGAKIFDKEKVDQILSHIKGKVAKVVNIEESIKKEYPPLLYDLTSLQQDANRLYALSAKTTLDIIQKLYEEHKVLTYPRTDSKYLTIDMYDTIKERLKAINSNEFIKYAKMLLNSNIEKSKRVFDNSKVSDHHAIIITEVAPKLYDLNINEKRIYDLVVKRFLSAFMKEHIYNHQKIIIDIDGYKFMATGNTDIEKGFKELYKNNELGDVIIPQIPKFNKGETFNTFGTSIKKDMTKAPDRYTEATLLASMEHPGKFVSNATLKNVLEQVSGIGTPATRADIIEKIFNAGYVELRGRSIYPTEKGKQLIKLVPANLKSPALTAEWELRLLQIEKGNDKKADFINAMIENTKELINEVNKTNITYHHDNATKQKCPNCGKILLEVSNKFGKSLVCSDRSCGYKKNISKNTNFMCPNCKKKLQEIISNEKSILICKCGFKENKESFIKKLGSKKDEMNKKSVNVYLKNQEKEIPTNNPFLDILSKIK